MHLEKIYSFKCKKMPMSKFRRAVMHRFYLMEKEQRRKRQKMQGLEHLILSIESNEFLK